MRTKRSDELNKIKTISFRLKKEDLELIKKASAFCDVPISKFIRDSATFQALEVMQGVINDEL